MEVSRAIWAPAVAATPPVFKIASPFIPAAASVASRHSRQHPQAAAARRAHSNSQDVVECISSTLKVQQLQTVVSRNGCEGKETGNGTWVAASSILAAVAAVGCCTVMGCSLFNIETAVALEGSQFEPATVFQRTCSGCHAGGGNILQPGATLFAKDLERNDTASVNDIFKITYSGKGRMPGYGENCTPRGQCTFGPRISDSDIHALAEFVRLQADQGWSKTIDP
ncbi:hypothetical protein BDL97_17G043100 [Sphagnum fallax]|nr:hypothetical protein BDL97_17G043100 [Sphagnum fallax]KAH8935708.1 hypothetical protein BDL97_17G043100 [Sphagnum fallax]